MVFEYYRRSSVVYDIHVITCVDLDLESTVLYVILYI